MRKLILILLLCPLISYAKNYTVITPFAPGSVVDIVCRKIFEMYDETYKTNTTIQNVPGADQILGHKQFLTLKEPSILCAGNGVGGFNQHFNSNSPKVDTLRPVTSIMSFTHFLFANSKYKTLDSLIKERKQQGRKVLLGAPSSTASKLVTHVLERQNVDYELVLYKKPTDSIVSLREATLDIYIDGGSIKPVVESMNEIVEIAHISIGNKSKSENLYRRYPITGNLVSSIILFVNSEVSTQDVIELNQKLIKVLNSKDMDVFFKERTPYHNVNYGSVKEAEQILIDIQRVIKDVYN